MRYYIVNDDSGAIALVAHEYHSGSVYCRSKKKSFNQSFNAMCNKNYYTTVKDNNSYRINLTDSRTYNWADNILRDLCNGVWHISDSGEVLNVESEIDGLVSKYIP